MPPKAAAPKAAAPKAAAAKVEAKAKAKPAKKVKAEEEVEEVPKVQEPDRKTFDAACDKIQETIAELKKKQDAITEEINTRSQGKDGYMQQRADLRVQIEEFQSKINALMARKEELNKAFGDKRQEGQEMKAQLAKMKKTIGYTSEADIDQRIAEIEIKMSTESISLKEEKDFIKEIAELKKRRPQVAKVKGMESSLQSRDTGDSIKGDLQSINAELTLYFDGKRSVQEKLKELNEGRQGQLGDLGDKFKDREVLQEKIKEKIQEKNQLRDEFYAKEREWRAYEKERREARFAKQAEERAAKQAEWEQAKRIKAAEKLDEQPHVSIMVLIEQTMAFCKGLVATKDSEVKEEKKEIEHNNPEGTQILAKKEDREEEFYFVPLAKKKAKGKSGKVKADGSSAPKPIKHNAVTFKLFDELKLDAPITTDDIPALLEKLEAMLESYKEKVRTWEAEREETKRKILEGTIQLEGAKKDVDAEARAEIAEAEKTGEE